MFSRFAHEVEADSSIGVHVVSWWSPGAFRLKKHKLDRPMSNPHGEHLKGWGAASRFSPPGLGIGLGDGDATVVDGTPA